MNRGRTEVWAHGGLRGRTFLDEGAGNVAETDD